MAACCEIEPTRRSTFPLVAMPAARRPPPLLCPTPWPLLMPSWPLLMSLFLLQGCLLASVVCNTVTGAYARVSHTKVVPGCRCTRRRVVGRQYPVCTYHSSPTRVLGPSIIVWCICLHGFLCLGISTATPDQQDTAKNEQTIRSVAPAQAMMMMMAPAPPPLPSPPRPSHTHSVPHLALVGTDS
jgi:hypothetical protein